MAQYLRTVVTACVFVVGAAVVTASAQSAPAEKARPQLVVLNTTVNRVNETLTIHGIGFGEQAPQVWCESSPMTVISSTDADIVVYLPAAVPDGTYLLTVVRGNGARDRDVFHMSVQSPSSGPKGDVGPKGDTGAAGPKGDVGPAGPKGDTGAAGPKGDTGAVGPKGETGAAGPKGDTGATGPKGDAGATGPKGDTGAVGPKGDAGASGPQGPTGEAGSPGAIGPMGPIGPQGIQGMPGVSGYEVVFTPFTSFTVNGNQTVALNATCPAGKVAIGGGFDLSGNTPPLSPVASFPFSADTWRLLVRLSQISAATFQVRAYAVCAAN